MSELNLTQRCFTLALQGSERAKYNKLVPDGYIPVIGPDVKEVLVDYIEEALALLRIETVARDHSAVGDAHNGWQICLGALSETTSLYTDGAFSGTKEFTSPQILSIIRYAYERGTRQPESYPLLCSDYIYPLPYIHIKDSHVCPVVALPVRNLFELIVVGLLYPSYPIYIQKGFTAHSFAYPWFGKTFSDGELIISRDPCTPILDVALDGSFQIFLPHTPDALALLDDVKSGDDPDWNYGILAVWQADDGDVKEAKVVTNVQLARILTSCSKLRRPVHLITYPYSTSSDRVALVQNAVSSFKLKSEVFPRLTVLGIEGTIHPTVLTDPITVPHGKFFFSNDDIRKEVFAYFAYGRPHLCGNVTHVKTVTVLWTDRDVADSHVNYEHFSFPLVYNEVGHGDVTVGVRATLQFPPFKRLSENVSIISQIGSLAPGVLSRSCQPFMASWEFLVNIHDVCDFLRLIRSHRFPWSKDPGQFEQLWSALGRGGRMSPLWSFISRDKFGSVNTGELQWLLSDFTPNDTAQGAPEVSLDDDQDSFDISILLPFLGSPSPIEYHSSGTRLPGASIATTYEGDNDGSSEDEQLAPYCTLEGEEDLGVGPGLSDGDGSGIGSDKDQDDSSVAEPGHSDSPPINTGSDDSESAEQCDTSAPLGPVISLLTLGATGILVFRLCGNRVPRSAHKNMLPLDSDSGEEFI